MNYRHHYHAGNYADVFKHVLLLQLIRAMQRKEKGFLYLDTHAGRGGYDLMLPSVLPDGREREPEHPAGIGRLWGASGLPAAVNDYLALVNRFNERKGGPADALQFYPGSPWLARLLMRPQDRMVLCELRAEEAEALDFEFAREKGVKVLALDGYTGLKAQLPPPEKRALVLIDPPFESKGEFSDIERGVAEAVRRLPGAVIAIWYPITERARTDAFQGALKSLAVPALFAELNIAGDGSQLRMKGSGLLVLNPPWQIEQEFRSVLPALLERLRVDAGAVATCAWLVPEK
ncbi:23S rRNA (adenine(2030)-N(6))-methyltransferase RlmJ [Oleiharenicola lentus]|jgi:23S rRNA (adenine2030-N6)-methyltransferase|uniref:Ribosomal RNA large subunit methyltransferase J n=1 Tax=Oleiharenicola lentus TaxID=2508720 RepID=A0A4V1M603_9BACT|nr:23S rRNA (adenine(2030)-N(6))-methyltransferase RlmJ [Oleiharenicola lentus]RXK53316.1 23S rRNA (adenine(2030)-N(6))-methyltransferase RlmJ [Oleiharenicola lentus]